MPRDMSREFQDATFARTYFRDCEDGPAITRKLMTDDITLNSPELIATLVQAFNEEVPLEDNAATEQQIKSLPSSASSESSKSSPESAASSGTSKESSDGTTRETSQKSSQSSSSSLFGK